MVKPTIKFKTYRQSPAVGGKIYGVPNLGDPVVADVTMQEVIDYAKLHNYSADTLSALLSQVIAGVGDLVARDGRPRMLSDLLKFEPVIKGTFDNLEQTVTNQKVLVRPRMLKEIKVKLDPSSYAWQNVNDSNSPRLISVAPSSTEFDSVSLGSFTSSLGQLFGWTLSGDRLAPNGNSDVDTIRYGVVLRRIVDGQPVDYHFERGDRSITGLTTTNGIFTHDVDNDDATNNTFVLTAIPGDPNQSWRVVDGVVTPASVIPGPGDVVIFQFQRSIGSGDTFTVEKKYTL